jgi:hypothetical protein
MIPNIKTEKTSKMIIKTRTKILKNYNRKILTKKKTKVRNKNNKKNIKSLKINI